MEKITKTYPNAQAVEAAVMEWAATRNVVSQPAVLLLPNYAAVDAFRHFHADEACLYGLTVSTPFEWVSDRWELFGTGMRPVSSLERQMMIALLLSQSDASSGYQMLASTPGAVNLIAAMAKEALPFVLEADDSSAMTESERGVCELLRAYASELERCGLTDYPLMLEHLAACDWPVPDVAIMGLEEFSPVEQSFLESISSRAFVCVYSNAYSGAPDCEKRAEELAQLQNLIFHPDGTSPVEPTGAVRFLLPAGGYAWPRLLVNQICQHAASSYLVSAKNPEHLFRQVADPLRKAGYRVRGEYRVPLPKTSVGQLTLMVMSAALKGEWDALMFSDVALNPLVGLPKRKSEQLDAKWRGTRLLTLDDVLSDLSDANEGFSAMAKAVREMDVEAFLDACSSEIASRFEWTERMRAQEFSACEALRKQFQTAQVVGLPLSDAIDYCQRLSVVVCVEVAPDSPGNDSAGASEKLVYITSLDRAAEFPLASFDVAVLSDLDASSYPVKAALSAKDILFEKLGLEEKPSPLERARRTFFNAMSPPEQELWLARVLKDADAQELYPAVMLEEVLDCYRRDLTQTSKGLEDKYFAVPSVLADYVETAGEDELYQTFAIRNNHQGLDVAVEQPPLGVLSADHIEYVAPSRKQVGEASLPLLSPSALESYLRCPYGWFAQRRLRLSRPDAGFGSMEMGSFAHSVLHSLHKRLPEHGYERVTAENLDFAHQLLDQRFDAHLEFQPSLSDYDNPLIPQTELEKQEVEALRRQLHDYLKLDAQLLPGFKPAYLEAAFGNKNPFEYAGCALNGCIDRVDVDDQGHAVVIDYKAKVGDSYQLKKDAPVAWADDILIPQKIQTLVYAQAVRKTLGLQVVGALYVSYGKDGGISGAVDPCYLGPLDVPGLKMDKCSCEGAFHDYLDLVEDLIAQAVQRLLAGQISPEPRGDKPCDYCPVSSCDRRV